MFGNEWVLRVELCEVTFLWEWPEYVLFADFPWIACPTRDNCAFPFFFLPLHVFRKIAVWHPSPRIVVKAWASLLCVAFWATLAKRWVLWKVCLNVMWGFYHSLEVKKQSVGSILAGQNSNFHFLTARVSHDVHVNMLHKWGPNSHWSLHAGLCCASANTSHRQAIFFFPPFTSARSSCCTL